ncbi:MAG TPA: D-alanyl-D-alanine carboxypeptidase family protein [Acidimicrobiales bacterium]
MTGPTAGDRSAGDPPDPAADAGRVAPDPFALRSRDRPLPAHLGRAAAARAGRSRARPAGGTGRRSDRVRRGTATGASGPPGAGDRDRPAGGGGGDRNRRAGAGRRPPWASGAARWGGAGLRAAARGDRVVAGGGGRGWRPPAPGGRRRGAAGRGALAAAGAGPLALVVLLVLVALVVAPGGGALSGGAPRAEPGEAALAEIPRGYLEAYMAAEDEHGVPWPLLAAMGQVLTEHGARSPYDTLRRADDQRYPVVDPPIAPGGDLPAPGGVHDTPAGDEAMAGRLAGQVAAPEAQAVDPGAGDGGLGPLLLSPLVFPRMTVEAAQSVAGSVDALARAMAEAAAGVPGAEEARAEGFADDLSPDAEALWREVVAAAPVVAGDSACLQPGPAAPAPQVVEVVWRCEMLRTPPVVWTPAGAVDGPEARSLLLDEAHAVAAAWSSYGATPCDPAAAHAGVFPLPVTEATDRCDPVANVRTAARLVLDQESRPLAARPGATEWERAAAGWATMPPALGPVGRNRFTTEGPPPDGFAPGAGCRAALGEALDAAAAQGYATFSGLAGFEPRAVDAGAARWDRAFEATAVAPLLAPGAACDPAGARAPALAWLTGELGARQVDGNPHPGLAGAIAYAGWAAGDATPPRPGETGLVPRLHNPRLVAPAVSRPRITGGTVAVSPAAFAERVMATARVYAGLAPAGRVEAAGWEALALIGVPEHAARAYAHALERIGGIEPGCGIDLPYLAAFGAMESGHGTVPVSTATGEADGPAPRAPVVWDPLTGESQPRLLGALLDGSGAGGNRTPHPNELAARDRAFYRQDEPHLRAVGPTQFLPAAWESVRAVADADDDGVADPFNYYDGALATAVKACRDGDGLATDADRRRAALAYNGAGWYADGVMERAAAYRADLAALGHAGGGPGAAPVGGPVTIVEVHGVRVDASIADRFRALVDAARADGLELAAGSGGWRSPERQIELRRAHCGTSGYAVYQMPASRCSPPTARPGTSLHERGLAVDFRCGGEPIGRQDRSNPCVAWLSAHAARFGFYNLPSEAWHWSVTGG